MHGGALSGLVAMVTGAGGGIGSAITRRLVRDGARVVLVGRRGEALRGVAEDLPPDSSLVLPADVTDPRSVRHLVEAAAEWREAIDIVVNVAGGGAFGAIEDIAPEDFRAAVALNLESVFWVAQAAVPHLVERRGTIINIASISGSGGNSGLAAYGAAKGGVVNLTRSLAVELGRHGVRCNSVSPGPVDVAAGRGLFTDPDMVEHYRRAIPLGRVGVPDDVAAATALLAHPDLAYVTGHDMVVDGGMTAGTGEPHFELSWLPRLERRIEAGEAPAASVTTGVQRRLDIDTP